MGRASQRKGRAGEMELARLLQGYGYDVQPRRAQSYGATPDLVGLPGVHIECKRNERLNVPEAMAQAVRDAEKFGDGAPTVFHRRNRSGWLVTMRLPDWMELYRIPEPCVLSGDSGDPKKAGGDEKHCGLRTSRNHVGRSGYLADHRAGAGASDRSEGTKRPYRGAAPHGGAER